MILVKIKTFILVCAVLLAPVVLIPAVVGAQADQDNTNVAVKKNDCKGTSIRAGAPEGSDEHCAILDYLMIFINALSGLVGVIVVAMIIYGGIQYSAAGDDPSKITEAKKKIINALLALAVFLFTYAFLQWIVPGGIF